MTMFVGEGEFAFSADQPAAIETRPRHPDELESKWAWLEERARPRARATAPEWGRMLSVIPPLELAPRMRVLQIGVGSGVLAVGLSVITGSPVTVVDLDDARVAEVTAALAAKGLAEQVRVVSGDGYAGPGRCGPYDRVVSLVGVLGLSPSWTSQLVSGGVIVAPVACGPGHVLVRAVSGPTGRVTGELQPVPEGVWWSPAGGLLGYRFVGSPPDPAFGLRPATIRRPALFPADLSPAAYGGVGQYLAADTGQVCTVGLTGTDESRGTLGLRTPDGTAAVVWRDGSIHATGPAAEGVADRAQRLVRAWCTVNRPTGSDWAVGFREHREDPISPALLVPDSWRRTWTRNGDQS